MKQAELVWREVNFTICIDTKTKKMRVCWKNVIVLKFMMFFLI